jgi:hypothetical protein
MLSRVIFVVALASAAPATTWAGVTIHATCAADVVREAARVELMRSELARALDGHAPAGAEVTIDASLVRLASTTPASTRDTLAIHVEIRGMLSDDRGRIRVTTTARATAQGRASDRALLEHDAISAAAQRLGATLRTRLSR